MLVIDACRSKTAKLSFFPSAKEEHFDASRSGRDFHLDGGQGFAFSTIWTAPATGWSSNGHVRLADARPVDWTNVDVQSVG